jgi:hypothetical protein
MVTAASRASVAAWVAESRPRVRLVSKLRPATDALRSVSVVLLSDVSRRPRCSSSDTDRFPISSMGRASMSARPPTSRRPETP